MLFTNIDYLAPDQSVQHGFVATFENKIVSVGKDRPQGDFGEEYDGKDRLLIPGFVNAHCHVPMTLLRGYGEGLPLQRWLTERVFPFEAQLDDEAVYWGAMLGIAEMLRSGITSFTEMYDHCGAIARAVLQSGVSCNLSRGLMCFDDTPLQQLIPFQETLQLFDEYNGAGDGRLQVDFCIHAEYTSNPDTVSGVANVASNRHARMHLHLSETKQEQQQCVERHGKTPAAYFEQLGVFANPTTAAHCVWVTEQDRAILKRNGVTVAHCPASNCKLGSGIAPVCELLEEGVPVAIGTDGVSSNNSFNFLQELRLAILLQNGTRQNPNAISAAQVLQMATEAGARSQGRNSGVIRCGAVADLAVVRCDSINMTPCYNPLVNLVYSANLPDTVLTMCAGKVLYRDGQLVTIDAERAKFEVNRAVQRVIGRVNS